MSSTINSVIKKEFVVSSKLFIPVYQNIASAPIPTRGSIAFDKATQSIIVSNGINWQAPTASNATPSLRGIVYGTTDDVETTTGYGHLCGSGSLSSTYIGISAGEFNVGPQTGLTFIGSFAGRVLQTGSNKVMIGASAGQNDGGLQDNSVGIGYVALSGANTGTDNVAIGTQSQFSNRGSGNVSAGVQTLCSQALTSGTYDNCIAIGGFRLLDDTTASSGLINIGSGPLSWDPDVGSTDVVYIGSGSTLPSNLTNVVALGSGTFAGAVVADNTFAIADDITQLRSLGLSVSASANILQFDPVTGLITQAASSRRFKENIVPMEKLPSLLESKVYTYDIGKEKSHGVISEEIPEMYATFDADGQRNGVKFSRIIMHLLAEIQRVNEEIEEIKRTRSL
ncbi:hypothetical protein ISTM_446 [Insectomime virus]|uniref:Peptidase S74 domain-containing protein n=1 Tax=Tunisvirus fontaine2 TaxID=1421067 RepID=V9SDV0_9VIRU|nr:hypothetical protein D1R32_gp356 [Tunisvirus fontaine2]AHA46344.1 hypothetical protein ISTM_446 [Insectomime virus]AHC55073.1 hypothetical protein TNS_ORF355 [Tunisvirus fontaine2]